jgi:hypothetical protein
MDIELWQWIVMGVAGPILVAMLRIWWHVEQQQTKEIDSLRKSNQDDHMKMRREMADTKQMLIDQHLTVRDKIEDVWKHLKNGH